MAIKTSATPGQIKFMEENPNLFVGYTGDMPTFAKRLREMHPAFRSSATSEEQILDYLNNSPSFASSLIDPVNHFVSAHPFTPPPPQLITETKPDTPKPNFDLSIDPLLTASAILNKSSEATKQARIPITDTINALIETQLPSLKKDIGESISQQVANLQSDAVRRGITGSSTEVGGIANIRASEPEALVKGRAELISKFAPIAQRANEDITQALQFEAETTGNLRKVIGEEQFNKLSLEQKERLTTAEFELKKELQAADQQFELTRQAIQNRFESHENEKDRALALYDLQVAQNARDQAKRAAGIKAITTLGGMLIGSAWGPMGMMAGGAAGGEAGNILNFSFT